MTQEKLLDPEKEFIVKNVIKQFDSEIVENVAKLKSILHGIPDVTGSLFEPTIENDKSKISFLHISNIAVKIQNAASAIEGNLRTYANIERGEYERTVYNRHIYKQLEELYENYTTEEGNLDWKTIVKEKGQKFANSFPLQDAIKAAILVKEGKLKID